MSLSMPSKPVPLSKALAAPWLLAQEWPWSVAMREKSSAYNSRKVQFVDVAL
jgi:hypothetical protein